MADQPGVGGRICAKLKSVTNKRKRCDDTDRKSISKFLDFVIGFWVIALKICGVCPLYLPATTANRFGISAIIAYFWVFVVLILSSVHLFAVTIPLLVSSPPGSLDGFIELLCSKQGEPVTFLSGIIFILQWRNIASSIGRIRRYEAGCFSQMEPRLIGLLSLAMAVPISVWLNQMISGWRAGGGYGVGKEIEFCANFYGFTTLRYMPLIRSVYYAFYIIMATISMYSAVMLSAVLALITGRVCSRMKSDLLFAAEESILERIVQDLLGMRSLINKLSQQVGSILLLFYIQSVLWTVYIINNMANIDRSQSVDKLFQSVSAVGILTAVVTFAMIYAHDQADISQDIVEQIVQETNRNKRKILVDFLHMASYSSAGFSLARIVTIDPAFIGTMIGVLFTYGTFVLQLKESRNENALPSLHHSDVMMQRNKTTAN